MKIYTSGYEVESYRGNLGAVPIESVKIIEQCTYHFSKRICFFYHITKEEPSFRTTAIFKIKHRNKTP